MTIAHDFPNFDPVSYASQGNAILGIRDSGKTVTAMGRAEKLIEAGIPITVIDPIGVWRFLRVPGKGDGYPVVVAGGMEGDLPLTPANAESIIRAAMQNRVSIVLDLYTMELSKADWKRICATAVRTMLYENKQYGLRHIFIEEAAEFCPQRVGPDQGQVYAEMEKLARMGGNALLGYTLINQRAEEVNKAVLELCDTLILHRQKGRNSLNALTKWLKIAGAKGDQKIVESMPMLKQGEAWAWLSGSDKPVRIQIPMKNSFHPDRRAMMGTADADFAEVPLNVDSFISAMKATLAKNDAAGEKKRTAERATATPAPIDIEAIKAAARDEGYQLGHQVGLGTADVVLKYLTENAPAAIAAIVGEAVALRDAQGFVQSERAPDATAGKSPMSHLSNGHTVNLRHANGQALKAGDLQQGDTVTYNPRTGLVSDIKRGGPGAELRILRVLAARAPARFTKAQWATLSGMKKSGGTWQTYVSRLRSAGYIDERDGLFGLTPIGAKAAGHVARPNSGSVIADWKEALGSGPSKMIDQIIASHPNGMDRANLADRVGMTASGGTFQTYLSRLKSNGLVEIHGRRIKASDTLFIDGRRS